MRERKASAGESLVEVMVSAVIFLMMMAILQGGIVFCTNAQQKSVQLRETNANILESLQTASGTSANGSAVYSFNASSVDGTQTGTDVLFTVNVGLGKKEVSYQNADGTTGQTTFYMFQKSGGTGGDSP